MNLYSITNWPEIFETCETRKYENLRWWPKPNKHDGLGFKRLAASRDKVDLYAAWALIGDVASKTLPREDRGKLIRNGRPLTAEDLSLMTGFPQSIFEKAFTFFCLPEVGWLTVSEFNLENAPNGSAAPVSNPVEPEARAASPGKTGRSPATPGRSPDECIEGREGIEGRESRPPPAKKGKPESNGAGYPLPTFDELPKPLWTGTARTMRQACDEQIEIVKSIAKRHRKPVMAKTEDGTEYRSGWELPAEASAAINAWEKRKNQISKALAG